MAQGIATSIPPSPFSPVPCRLLSITCSSCSCHPLLQREEISPLQWTDLVFSASWSLPMLSLDGDIWTGWAFLMDVVLGRCGSTYRYLVVESSTGGRYSGYSRLSTPVRLVCRVDGSYKPDGAAATSFISATPDDACCLSTALLATPIPLFFHPTPPLFCLPPSPWSWCRVAGLFSAWRRGFGAHVRGILWRVRARGRCARPAWACARARAAAAPHFAARRPQTTISRVRCFLHEQPLYSPLRFPYASDASFCQHVVPFRWRFLP